MENILVGKTILGIMAAKDRKAILFNTDSGEVKAKCTGDCCSETWVQHIEAPALGYPAKVIYAGNMRMPALGDMPDRDCVAYYGFKIATDMGDIVIDYRNESNGYYGGDLSWPGDYFYKGVFGQNVSDEDWEDVSKGF